MGSCLKTVGHAASSGRGGCERSTWGVASKQSDMQPVQEEEVVREVVEEVEARRTRGGWWRMRRAPRPKWKLRPGRTEDNRWDGTGGPRAPASNPFWCCF